MRAIANIYDKANGVEVNVYTISSIYGIKLLQALSVEVLFDLVASDTTPVFAQFCKQLGTETNPNWVRSQAAEELYNREILDADTMQHAKDDGLDARHIDMFLTK